MRYRQQREKPENAYVAGQPACSLGIKPEAELFREIGNHLRVCEDPAHGIGYRIVD
jgi:hypothetical protein